MAKIKPIPDGLAKAAGKMDSAGRWYPHDEYRVPGSFQVRSPSRAHPYGYLRHFYSAKYAGLLALHRPDLYVDLVGLENADVRAIDQTTPEGRALVAEIAAAKLNKAKAA